MNVPPTFLQEAVCSAGGTVIHDTTSLPPFPSARSVDDIADEAFVGLARRVAERERSDMELGLLTRLEDATLQSPPKQDDDEAS